MKKSLIISEEEKNRILKLHNILKEQDYLDPKTYGFNSNSMTPTVDNTKVNIQNRNYAIGNEKKVESSYEKSKHINKSDSDHLNAAILSFAVAFVPIVGPFVSAGIQLGDAYNYLYKDKDTKMAGLSALFALLPFAGSALKFLPKMSKLGTNNIKNLGEKIGKGIPLSKAETEALDELIKNNNIVAKELEKSVITQASQKAAETTVTSSVKNQLLNLTKGSLNLVGNFGKAAAPYIAAQQVYDKTYDYAQQDTPKSLATSEGLNWDFVKYSFGSSGSAEDNIKLKEAWKNGWRPGNIVPEKLQTLAYQELYKKENEGVQKLADMISSKTQTKTS